jgi:hypothetical protein
MSLESDEAPDFVCHNCIGDAYLKADIRKKGLKRSCMICERRRRGILFDDLCERVHAILSNEFELTANEPENWALYKEGDFNLERDGEPLDAVLQEILECDEVLIAAVKERLSDLHFSFDDALSGEEDPYGHEAQYELRKSDGSSFRNAWSRFQEEIRSHSRFFSQTAKSILDDIIGELNRFRAFKRDLIRDAGPGTATVVIFRARRAFTEGDIKEIVEHPARELGPPPSRLAASGRMNPKWISMFYGALDPDTCVSEIRAPVGSSVVIGKFQILRPLRLLDLEAFRHLSVERASYFDPDYRRLRDKAEFLKRLVDIMSRPVMPSDEDFQYLPTQAVAEYVSEHIQPKLDGLIFPSSQRDGKGENVVLFRRASTVDSDGSDDLEHETHFGWDSEDDVDRDISIFTTPKEPASTKLKDPAPDDPLFELDFPISDEFPDLSLVLAEPPALRIDLSTIAGRSGEEVRDKGLKC